MLFLKLKVHRTKEVICRRVKDMHYFLLIGYDNKVPVEMAFFQFDENMTARLDEVEVANKSNL